MFSANKASALKALENFLPRAGRDYAAQRNYDFGPERRDNVSMLSPWVRVRILPEWEIIRSVRETHSDSAAGKFIDEVCWHTYWRGWLLQHPDAWKDYEAERETLLGDYERQIGYTRAIEGKTGIECFDVWTRELIETGYLHNHARMWYASIWTHTLKLPWVLGAAFFHRHLYDGDPASNTLSWRWVAGVHTQGKSYLARPDNIAKYTDGRFRPQEPFAQEALDLTDDYPKPRAVSVETADKLPGDGRIGLVVNENDLSASSWLGDSLNAVATCGALPEAAYEAHAVAEPVRTFRRDCLRETLTDDAPVFSGVGQITQWAGEHSLDAVVMSEPGVGFWTLELLKLRSDLAHQGRTLHTVRHWWDAHFIPHASKGFFKLKQAIPDALDRL